MTCNRRLLLLLPLLILLFFTTPLASFPTPTPLPDNFHAVLYMNLSSTGHLQITNLWYDWPRRRNLNLIQKQLQPLLYDVEWNNGTSFYYTLGDGGTCDVMYFSVGIPRKDFMDGANYLGREVMDGFLCDVWEKLEFIWVYQDVVTKRPVRWDFYDGIQIHFMTYEVGAVLDDDSQWQAPAYCFNNEEGNNKSLHENRRRSEEAEHGTVDWSFRKLVQFM